MLPKKVIKKDKLYFLVKEYENFGLYKSLDGIRECFSKKDLGLLVEQVKPPKLANNGGAIMF